MVLKKLAKGYYLNWFAFGFGFGGGLFAAVSGHTISAFIIAISAMIQIPFMHKSLREDI